MPQSAPRFNAVPKSTAKQVNDRPSAAKRGYDRRWKAIRLKTLIRDNFTCVDCHSVVDGKHAHVDHIIPREDGGSDEPDNLATRCDRCHGKKTATQDGGFGNRDRGGQISTTDKTEDHVPSHAKNYTSYG